MVRLLGGLDWWKYGIERLAALARERGIALAVLPGEDRDDAAACRGVDSCRTQELDALLPYFREGGRENLRALLARGSRVCAGCDLEYARRSRATPWPAICRAGAVELDRLTATLDAGKPVVPIIFYRAMLLAADTAPVDALCAALAARGLAPAALLLSPA